VRQALKSGTQSGQTYFTQTVVTEKSHPQGANIFWDEAVANETQGL